MEIPDVNNMRFKRVEWRLSMGKYYAFVTVEDLGFKGEGFQPPQYKKYWGEAERDVPSDIEKVILQGGTWENLP